MFGDSNLMLAQILHCPERLNLSEHSFDVSQSSACSLQDGEVFRAGTAWSPSLAPTLAVCCELARWQRTRRFHHTDTRNSSHDISTDGADEVTAENEDVSQVAGATGVGAGLSGHPLRPGWLQRHIASAARGCVST